MRFLNILLARWSTIVIETGYPNEVSQRAVYVIDKAVDAGKMIGSIISYYLALGQYDLC